MQIPKTFLGDAYASERFESIVNHARRTNPFYRRWIGDAETIPIVDRPVFQANNDEILNGYLMTGRTSGSTGIPVRISWSREREGLESQDTLRFMARLGGELSSTSIVYHGDTDPPPARRVTVNLPIDEQIETIQRRYTETQAVAVTTLPTNAEMLARAVIDRGLDMSFVARLGVYGEVFEPAQEELIRKAFPNARIWSTYSSVEFGIIATRCVDEPGFHHIMSHKLGLEVLNEEDEPCENDEVGRLVVTDYFNRQSPLIRYEIGDYAARGACPCGRTHLPGLSRVIGKVRGVLIHPSGRRVMFLDLSASLRDIEGMGQYQVIQESLCRFVVRVRADRRIDEEVRLAFESHFGCDPELDIRYESEEIPRDASGKFHASICNVQL